MSENNRLEMFLALNAEAFKNGLRAVGASTKTMASGATTAFADTKARLQENMAAVKSYNAELSRHGGIISSVKENVIGLAGAVGVSISVMAGVGKLVGVTREFDKLNAGLITATGSVDGAKEKFAWIQGFAAKTPYDLAQVTDSFIKLANFGLNPSEQALTSYGNTASSLGKDLNQMIEAVADATTGEFERLKEFGIKAKSEGDQVSFTFRGITTTVGKNAKEIEDYLIKLGETNFGGAMENRMATLDGALSNFGDEWDKLFLNISQSGIGDAIADGVRYGISILERLNEKIKSGELLEFIQTNKEMIITVASAVAGIVALTVSAAALAPVIYTVTAAWRAVNIVMLASTGGQLLPWLGSVITSLKGVQLAALSTAGALGAAAGATLALTGGYALGSKIAEWEYFSDVVKANKNALAEVPAKFAAITAATGVSIRSFDDLDKAQKAGLIRFNDITGAWEKVARSAEKSAADQTGAQKTATDEMKKAYKSYADTVKRLQDSIAGREQEVAAQLREMGRSGMSDLNAWKDRKREAEELARAAKLAGDESKKAFAAGDISTGEKKAQESANLYDKARGAAADLNREIKSGDRVIASQQQNLKIAMSMVEEYGKKASEIEKSQEKTVNEAAKALDEKSGGALAKELPEIAKQFGAVIKQSEDLAGKSAEFNTAWNNAYDEFLAKGNASVAELDGALSELTKDRHITVYVKEVSEKSSGGLIGYMRGGMIQALANGGSVLRNILSGGFLPGFGGGDTVPLMGERGEVMIRKESVKAAGIRASLAFNSGRWDVVVSELMQRFRLNLSDLVGYQLGGIIDSMPALPQVSTQYLADGGQVTGAGSGAIYNQSVTVNVSGTGGQSSAREIAKTVLNELQKMHRSRS
ncbi:MAG: tape measure protein [Limnohabitans sp.]